MSYLSETSCDGKLFTAGVSKVYLLKGYSIKTSDIFSQSLFKSGVTEMTLLLVFLLQAAIFMPVISQLIL